MCCAPQEIFCCTVVVGPSGFQNSWQAWQNVCPGQPADSFDEGRCKVLADEWTACTQAVRKLHAHLRAAKEAAVERTLPQLRAPASMQPHAVDMDQELDDAARVRALTSFLRMSS